MVFRSGAWNSCVRPAEYWSMAVTRPMSAVPVPTPLNNCINELRASSLLATGLANREFLHYNQENSTQDEVSYKEWDR